jgi:PKHD-type hydroxylase
LPQRNAHVAQVANMLLQIPKLLTAEQVARFRARIDAAKWIDGNVTSGHQSAQAKYNQQLPEESIEAREVGEEIMAALSRSPLFFSAALPKQVYPPLFNRYAGGMNFGNHVDGAMRVHAQSGRRIRTDISATLFLTAPEDYDGGELLVEDTYGVHSVKLPAGDMVIYPATSLHRVTEVTRGARVSSFFWIESMIRDEAQRSLLFDMDMALVRLSQQVREHPSLITLTGCYHNLLRMWGQS